MSYEMTIDKHKNFLHARVSGENTRDNVFGYMSDLVGECNRQNCFRVLIEERLDGPRLPPMEVFDMISEGSLNALGFFEAIAFVDEQMGETMAFAETVAVNRGLPMMTFKSVAAAREWIEREDTGMRGLDEQWDDGPEPG